MHHVRTALFFAVVLGAAVVLGRFTWAVLVPGAAEAAGAAGAWLSAVPGWVWWVVFGTAMSLLCPAKHACRGRWGRCER